MPFSIQTGRVELERASTGQRVAEVQLLPPGGIRLEEGSTAVQVVGSTEVTDPEALGGAVAQAVSSGKLSDVDLLAMMRLRASFEEFRIGVDVGIALAPEDLFDDAEEPPALGRAAPGGRRLRTASTASGSTEPPCSSAALGLESVHANFARGAAGAVELALFASARSGLCLSTYDLLEVRLPSMRFSLDAARSGEAAEMGLAALQLDLRRPVLPVAGFVALREHHQQGASAVLKALMGEGNATRVQLKAQRGSSCVLQRVLAAVPKLAEFEVGAGALEGRRLAAGASDVPAVALAALAGELGGSAASPGAHLRIAANLRQWLPRGASSVTVSGVLPEVAFQAHVEGGVPGCGGRRAVLAELSTSSAPLRTTGGVLDLPLLVGTSGEWSESLAAGVSGMLSSGAGLTLRLRPKPSNTSLLSKVMSWWEVEQVIRRADDGGRGGGAPRATTGSPLPIGANLTAASTTTVEAATTTSTRTSTVTTSTTGGSSTTEATTTASLVNASGGTVPNGIGAAGETDGAASSDGLGLNISVVSSRDSLSVGVLLQDIVGKAGMLANATIDGSVLLTTDGRPVGYGSLAAGPLSEGIRADAGTYSSVRTQALEALSGLLDRFLSDASSSRGRAPVKVAGGVNVTVPVDGLEQPLPASLGLDVDLFREPASLAHALLSLNAGVQNFSARGGGALNLTEALAANASGNLELLGSLPGSFSSLVDGCELNLTIRVPPLALAPSDLGFEAPCAGGSARALAAAGAVAGAAGGSGSSSEPFAVSLRATVLGGAAPGQDVEVPCVFEGLCPFGAHDPKHVSLEVGANASGRLGPLSMGKLRLHLSSSMALEVAANRTSTGVTGVSIGGELAGAVAMDRGTIRAPVRLVVPNETLAAALLASGTAWSIRGAEGPGGDFLGALLASMSKPLLQGGGGAGEVPDGRRLMSSALLSSLQMVAADSRSMTLRVNLPVPRMTSMDAELLLGDALNASVDFEGDRVAGLRWSPARLSLRGGGLPLDFSLLQADAAARQKLEDFLELVLQMGAANASKPPLQLGGRASGGAAGAPGFGFQMAALVPQPLAGLGLLGSGDTCGGGGGRRLMASLFKGAGYQLRDLRMRWLSFTIELLVEVTVTLENPLPIALTIETLAGDLYLEDSDGASYFYMFSLPGQRQYTVGSFSESMNVTALPGQDFTLTISLWLSSYAAWRFYEESQKPTFHIMLPRLHLGVAMRHSVAEDPFRMTLRTGLDCIPLTGSR